MGQDHHKSKKKYHHRNDDDDDTSSNLEKKASNKGVAKDEFDKKVPTNHEEIIKELNHMNLSKNEVKENYKFYKTNYSKLLKINKIIDNIKFANIHNLTPQEVLAKIVPENELKNMEVPDFYAEQEEKDKYNEAPVCPEYTLPPTWEELFSLKSSNKAINKLYIQSEIERVAKNHADWKKESLEKWELIINENNYKDYDKDYKEQTGKLKTETKDEKIIIKEIKSLEYFKVTENEIKNNIDYYTKNIDELKKINTIISKAKEGGIYDLTVEEAIKKVYPDNPNHFNFQGKWEDLFNLQCPKYKTDFLMELTETNLIYGDINNEELNDNIENEKKNNLIEVIFDKAKEGNLIEKSNPRELTSKINSFANIYFPYEWENLREYNLENYILEILLRAIEIEILKNKYSKTDKKRNYDYYDELIGEENYNKYKTYYNEFQMKNKFLDDVNKTIGYIEKNDSYISDDDVVKDIKEFKNLTFDCLSEDLKISTILDYNKKFEKIKEKIEKEKDKNRKNKNYNNYNSYNNSSYNSGSSNNSGSSKNDDRKKCYLNICQNCKNTCIGCRKKLKGGEGIGKGFKIHQKCQTSSSSSCYFCDKTRDVKERETVYLCKPCYNSHKFDSSVCVECHKSFN